MSPIGTIVQPLQASYALPGFREAKVYDAMRMGVISCAPDTPVREVARMMSTYHVHCVVVARDVPDGQVAWAVVSDLDLVQAGAEAANRTAAEIARSEVVTVTGGNTLEHAARLMDKHDTSHLVVVHPDTGHPLGVLSTLDLAAVLAWGETV
jgi:CBS domain-containing protein